MPLTKPDSCRSCYGWEWACPSVGTGFVKPRGTGVNGVLIIGEAAGEEESIQGRPFVGKSGELLAKQMLRGGMNLDDFRIANVLSCRPPKNLLAGQWYATEVIDHCRPNLDAEIRAFKPKCIVALGNTAMRWLVPDMPVGILEAQGYVFWSAKYQTWVLPTIHPSWIVRGKTAYAQCLIHSLQRAVEIAKDGYKYAEFDYTLDCTPSQAHTWVDEFEAHATAHPDLYLSTDIETPGKDADEEELDLEDGSDYIILRCGYSYKQGHGLSIPWDGPFRSVHERLLHHGCQKLFWNGSFDVPRILSHGIVIEGACRDAMDCWHVLNSDLKKSLGFVTPFFYQSMPMWKHSSSQQPAFYNAADADACGVNMRGTVELLKKHGMWQVYNEYICELDPVFSAMTRAGMPVDRYRRIESSKALIEKRNAVRIQIESVIPQEIKALSPKAGYVREPADKTGLSQIVINGVRKQYCSGCGLESPKKAHFKARQGKFCSACGAKYTATHVKPKRTGNPCEAAGCDSRNLNVCAGATITERLEGETRWARVLSFVTSPKNILKYQVVRKHPIITVKKGDEKKATTDIKTINKLIGKYPTDPFYPLVKTDREYTKVGGTYIGWYNPGSGQLDGGFPVGRDGRVHGVFRHTPSTLRSSMVSPNLQNCYAEDTQVLTHTGWKYFAALTESDAVAQCNHDGTIEFAQPEQIISYSYTGPMIHIRGEWVDLLVTPDHNMVSWTRTGSLKREPAIDWYAQWGDDELTVVDRRMRRGGLRVGGLHLTDAERNVLAQAVAVQAEGYVRYDTPQVEVAVTSTRKRAQLSEIFHNVRVRKNDAVAWVRFDDPCLEWLHMPSKNFRTERLIALCAEDLRWFISEVMRWDGDFTRGCLYLQHPKRIGAVEAVQIAAVLSGHSTSWTTKPYTAYEAVNVHRSYERWASRLEITRDHYKGNVWCVTVPSGNILVRRNKDIVVCGNCPRGDDSEVQKWVKQMFVAPPGKVFRARDFEGIEAQLVGYHAGSRDFLRLAKIDIHSYFTAHNLYRLGRITAADLPDLSWSDNDLRDYGKRFIKAQFNAERNIGKRCVHAGDYLVGPKVLSEAYPEWFPRIKDAAAVLKFFYEVFPAISKWHERVCLQVDKTAVMRNSFGHVHRFYQVLSWSKVDGKWDWDYADDAKRAIAFNPQSDAAFIGKKALKRLYYTYPDTMRQWLRLFIHDEIFCEPPKDRDDECDMLLKREMEMPLEELPLDPSWGFGTHLNIATSGKGGLSWGDM